ncbi:hypothetical protein X739_02405 [Mesorhizobium sp. LNHC220B00]|nr:hypothetical protein X739_02405 [Mesorhizobium sp. LNHC220B00]ESY96700.1 hypothetical protein X741_05110 [Mesorhizobium sp. LNHC229A00]ESZ00068.1 hypothetical protein X738_09900 [Mesorhizobium sp. LNHC209A00]
MGVDERFIFARRKVFAIQEFANRVLTRPVERDSVFSSTSDGKCLAQPAMIHSLPAKSSMGAAARSR